MNKNLRTLGTILSLVAITSFSMTSCGAKTEEATAAPATPVEVVVETPVEAPVEAPVCGGADSTAAVTTCDAAATPAVK